MIYVDADQIVRGDLATLWRRDLGGAPIAMTPFCRADANNLTTGYRFWTSGFWASHLGSRPYHISALFIADLTAFRALGGARAEGRPSGVADIYRDTYQALTADPSSLANLDQDLPNYLQHQVPPQPCSIPASCTERSASPQAAPGCTIARTSHVSALAQVPIHSLPEEWLWCETWCGNASRPTAQTIDLCQNPLTKEPKLDQVRGDGCGWVHGRGLEGAWVPGAQCASRCSMLMCVHRQARRIGGTRWKEIDETLEARLAATPSDAALGAAGRGASNSEEKGEL